MAELFKTIDLSGKPPALDQFKQGIKMVYAGVTERVKGLLGKHEGIGSTGRITRDYRELLFPEQESDDGVIELLRNKRTVDVGSGVIHSDAEALPSQLTARYPNSLYACVEPRLGYEVGHPKGFSPDLQPLDGNLLQVIGDSRAALVAATGERLPFADESMDYYLSCYLMPWHFTSPRVIMNFLTELRRVLKVNGEARLGPLSEENYDLLTKNRRLRQFLHDHFEVQVFTKNNSGNDQMQWVGFDYSLRLLRKS
ncbi:MAG: class I SAM-dependent methyltransferase [Candidatus Peregrinibacteria bacterium]|nr:class I SAM-dependent methyltransferase [Candidatus Peregrinibacteria bacterium]